VKKVYFAWLLPTLVIHNKYISKFQANTFPFEGNRTNQFCKEWIWLQQKV